MKKTNGTPKSEMHALCGASFLAGVTTGAVVGSMAGPPGAIAGGVVGGAVGALAGSVLEHEQHASDRHDRELDEEIGVIGHPDEKMPAAALLRAEHARLEVIYDRLLEAYRYGDWPDVAAQWAIFEPSLRAHMKLEEERVFPAFRELDPAEAEYLQSEHDALREALDVLAVNIELHAVTALDANALVERLRAHRAREERLLYPWMEETSTVS